MMYTTQAIYEKEILFLCPSKGRAKTCTTHKVLPDVKYLVSPEEHDDYCDNVGENNVLRLPEGIQVAPMGKCRALNYALDNYKTNGNMVLFTDDDIVKIYRIDFLDKNKAKEITVDELRIVLSKMKFIADNIGAKIGGFACLSTPDTLQMGLSNRFKLTQKKYIDGKATIVFDDDGTRYDEKLYLKEDIDFNCQSLLKNKRTLSAQFVCFVGKALSNSGGVVDVRSNDEELRQGSMMIKKYGQMLRLRVSNSGSGVRRKAVQFGIK